MWLCIVGLYDHPAETFAGKTGRMSITGEETTKPTIKIYIIHNSVISFNDKQRAQHGL